MKKLEYDSEAWRWRTEYWIVVWWLDLTGLSSRGRGATQRWWSIWNITSPGRSCVNSGKGDINQLFKLGKIFHFEVDPGEESAVWTGVKSDIWRVMRRSCNEKQDSITSRTRRTCWVQFSRRRWGHSSGHSVPQIPLPPRLHIWLLAVTCLQVVVMFTVMTF